jgi:hypothetical protein
MCYKSYIHSIDSDIPTTVGEGWKRFLALEILTDQTQQGLWITNLNILKEHFLCTSLLRGLSRSRFLRSVFLQEHLTPRSCILHGILTPKVSSCMLYYSAECLPAGRADSAKYHSAVRVTPRGGRLLENFGTLRSVLPQEVWLRKNRHFLLLHGIEASTMAVFRSLKTPLNILYALSLHWHVLGYY